MEVQEKILMHLSAYGKENKYRLAKALKIDVSELTEALDILEKEGKIEIKEGNAMLVKGKEPITTKQEKEEIIQEVETKEQPKEEPEEEQKTEVSEESAEERIEEKPTEEVIEEERIKGTVKFYKTNKGFGYIRGDDGQEYRVHESGLKEGFIIKADDRVSFKVFQGHKGPEADDVETINQNAA